MKGCIASYAFEAMEVASYRILAAAAQSMGDHETARVCQEIMEEEQAMADWLAQHMPSLTARYLAVAETAEITLVRRLYQCRMSATACSWQSARAGRRGEPQLTPDASNFDRATGI